MEVDPIAKSLIYLFRIFKYIRRLLSLGVSSIKQKRKTDLDLRAVFGNYSETGFAMGHWAVRTR